MSRISTTCPHCGQRSSRVIDSRPSAHSVRRRRLCYGCDGRYTTHELLISAGRGTPQLVARLAWLESPRDWQIYYRWLEPQLAPNWLGIIPDVIAEGGQAQDALIDQWPFGELGIPVWHTGETIARLLRLLDEWPRVAIGSTDEHWQVGGEPWLARMDEAWREIERRHEEPDIHMLRGTDVAHLYPFKSADSSSLAQNGHRYAAPLFDEVDCPFRGTIAYADRLESPEKPLKPRICRDLHILPENSIFPGFFE